MLVFLNGEFVAEEQAVVSVFDRGFLYGDGLFETMLVHQGRAFRWQPHLARLRQGATFLQLRMPYSDGELLKSAEELVRRNAMPEALLRLTLTRGVGVRGYSPHGAEHPTLVMSLHPAPPLDAPGTPGWRVITASPRLPAREPLARFKTCNKLAQILARAEADTAGAEEAVVLNTDGFVVEGTSSNLFWIEEQTVWTPALAAGILQGVTRAVTLELCEKLGIRARDANVTPAELPKKSGVFFSLSSRGIVAGESLDGRALGQSPMVGQLQAAYLELVHQETGSGVG
jgi:aminodeoxychorismate lyase